VCRGVSEASQRAARDGRKRLVDIFLSTAAGRAERRAVARLNTRSPSLSRHRCTIAGQRNGSHLVTSPVGDEALRPCHFSIDTRRRRPHSEVGARTSAPSAPVSTRGRDVAINESKRRSAPALAPTIQHSHGADLALRRRFQGKGGKDRVQNDDSLVCPPHATPCAARDERRSGTRRRRLRMARHPKAPTGSSPVANSSVWTPRTEGETIRRREWQAQSKQVGVVWPLPGRPLVQR